MFSGEWAGLAPEAYWSERRFWSLENLGFVPYSCVTLEQIMFSFLSQLPHLKWVATISKWHLDAKHESKIPILKKCSQWWHSVYWATYGETSINDTFKSPLVKGRHEKPTCMCFQLCPILYNLMDCSLPRASDHGIHQARILKWVAMTSSRGSSRLRDQTCVSYVSTWEAQKPTWRRWKCWATGHQSQGPGPCDQGKLISLSPQERLSTSQVNQLSNLAFYSITWVTLTSEPGPSQKEVCFQPGWERSLGEDGYMCMSGWVPLLSTRKDHNAVNQLDSDIK